MIAIVKVLSQYGTTMSSFFRYTALYKFELRHQKTNTSASQGTSKEGGGVVDHGGRERNKT